MTNDQIGSVLRRALQQGWIREEDTAVIFYDLTFLEERLRTLQSSFPPGTLHALAIKANPLRKIMEITRDLGMGVEAASMGEVNLALRCGYPPEKIVYDSPVKTREELEHALRAGVHINVDNLSELERVNNLLNSIESKSTIGIRINPQVGVGSILESSVAGEYSKFGVPVRTARAALEQALTDHPWLTGVHLHVGSQGCSLELLTEGIGVLYDLVMEINKKRELKGYPSISVFDIGGGLPVAYRNHDHPPSMEAYVEAIRKRAPRLLTADLPRRQAGYRLLTEFGRWAYTNCGWTVSRVEYVKHDPGIHTAMIHVGADLFVRECLNPKDWQHEYDVFDREGKTKKKAEGRRQKAVESPQLALGSRQLAVEREKESEELRVKSENNLEPYNLAGPLCFSGDILAKGVMLPPVEEGDYLVIRDTGSYTFSMWSRYNSRQAPRILAYRNDGNHFELVRERETLDEVAGFWE
jgi:diaminopimelate decarboxylase